MEKTNGLIFLLIVVLIAVLLGFLAKKRGRSPVIWFIAGLLFGWLGFILLYLLPDESQQEEDEGKVYEKQEAKESIATIDVAPIPEKELHSWYYLSADQKSEGPLELSQLKVIFKEGKVKETTYVWHEGMGDWKKVEELPWLKEQLQSE